MTPYQVNWSISETKWEIEQSAWFRETDLDLGQDTEVGSDKEPSPWS